MNDLVVTCSDGRTATIDPSAGPGNITPDDPGAILFGAAVNRGDGNQQGTAYWNVLLGMNLDAAPGVTCTLTTTGTASDTALTAGATPDHTRYPVINWNVQLSSGTDRTCTRHPLNGEGSGVATTYTTISTPANFGYQMARLDNGNATSTAPVVPQATCRCWTQSDLDNLIASHGPMSYGHGGIWYGFDNPPSPWAIAHSVDVVFPGFDPTLDVTMEDPSPDNYFANIPLYSCANWGATTQITAVNAAFFDPPAPPATRASSTSRESRPSCAGTCS